MTQALSLAAKNIRPNTTYVKKHNTRK